MGRRSSNTLEIHISLKGSFLALSTIRVKQSAVIAAELFNCELRFELAGGTHPVVSAFVSSVMLHSVDDTEKWVTFHTSFWIGWLHELPLDCGLVMLRLSYLKKQLDRFFCIQPRGLSCPYTGISNQFTICPLAPPCSFLSLSEPSCWIVTCHTCNALSLLWFGNWINNQNGILTLIHLEWHLHHPVHQFGLVLSCFQTWLPFIFSSPFYPCDELLSKYPVSDVSHNPHYISLTIRLLLVLTD